MINTTQFTRLPGNHDSDLVQTRNSSSEQTKKAQRHRRPKNLKTPSLVQIQAAHTAWCQTSPSMSTHRRAASPGPLSLTILLSLVHFCDPADKTKLIAPPVQVPSTLAEDLNQLGRGFEHGFHRPCPSPPSESISAFSIELLGLLHICAVQPTTSVPRCWCARAPQTEATRFTDTCQGWF